MIQATDRGKSREALYAVFRAVSVAFTILGPVAMIGGAVVITLIESDWWFPLFLAFLGGITLIFFSLYVSLAVLLWELCRFFRRRAGLDMGDTPVKLMMHRLFLPVSVAGVASGVLLLLIWLDLINGAFAWIHLACGGVLVLLLAVYGLYTVSRRRADRRRAETERLAREKQEWDSYLS
jgi:hypothetical protein